VEPELALDPRDPALLESLSRVAAVRAPDEAQLAPSRGDLASARGYDREDLHAIADMARSYLFGGAPHLALVLFEGLHAVAPAEPYFALGLGLTYDRLDRAADAARSYAQAARLAPADARPLVNLAELRIEAGDRSAARALLGSAVLKAERAADRALAAKAAALLSQLGAA
jgi:Flp pilus assembly protein TadD